MSSYELREHKVKHTSKIPVAYGDEVELPVREFDGTPGNGNGNGHGHGHGQDREPVLMLFGFPMRVTGKGGFERSLTGTPALWEPGIDERAWAACMEDDPVGSKWGPRGNGDYEGVLRYRNTCW